MTDEDWIDRKINSNILIDILTEKEHKITRAFLNGTLNDIKKYEKSEEFSKNIKCSSETKYMMLLMCSENLLEIVKLIERLVDKATFEWLCTATDETFKQVNYEHTPEQHYKRKFSPVHVAAYHGNTEILQWFVSNYNKFLHKKCVGNRTPLHIAAQRGHTEAMYVLLDQEESQYKDMIQQKTKDGETVLHLTCSFGNFNAVETCNKVSKKKI